MNHWYEQKKLICVALEWRKEHVSLVDVEQKAENQSLENFSFANMCVDTAEKAPSKISFT